MYFFLQIILTKSFIFKECEKSFNWSMYFKQFFVVQIFDILYLFRSFFNFLYSFFFTNLLFCDIYLLNIWAVWFLIHQILVIIFCLGKKLWKIGVNCVPNNRTILLVTNLYICSSNLCLSVCSVSRQSWVPNLVTIN